jgi:uncharacterized protein YukJ
MAHRRSKPANARRTYGVLVGKIVDGQLKPSGSSPHYEVWVRADTKDFRVAINVRSVDGSDLLVHYDPDFQNPTKRNLAALAAGAGGFTALQTGVGGEGLDYLRDGLFPIDTMQAIPESGSGVSLLNLLDGQIERAKADDDAIAVAFGEFFTDQGPDETFGFSPEQGVHDIHMMQGNRGSFADDNRVNGDGAFFIRFTKGETIAFFARFKAQETKTDDTTGAPLDG